MIRNFPLIIRRLIMSERKKSGAIAFDEIMTLPEIAEFLKIGEKTVTKMVQEGKLPGTKIGGQWRFMREIVKEWLTRQMQAVPQNELYSLIETEPRIVPLSRLITEDYMILDLKPGTKRSVLRQLITPLKNNGVIDNPDDFLEKLVAREKMMTTAIAPMTAFPHPRDPSEWNIREPRIVLGRCLAGTDFKSLNGKPTYVFFLICAGSDIAHLRILAKTALIGRDEDIIRRIVEAGTADDINRILIEMDGRMIINI